MQHLSHSPLMKRLLRALEAQSATDFQIEMGASVAPVSAIIRCRIGNLPLVVPVITHRGIHATGLIGLLRPLHVESSQANGLFVLGVENSDMGLADSLLHELTRTSVLSIPVGS
jgi:hypothetical protein